MDLIALLAKSESLFMLSLFYNVLFLLLPVANTPGKFTILVSPVSLLTVVSLHRQLKISIKYQSGVTQMNIRMPQSFMSALMKWKLRIYTSHYNFFSCLFSELSLFSSYVVTLPQRKPQGFYNSPMRDIGIHLRHRDTGQFWEINASVGFQQITRRVSLKFPSYTFVPDRANYV